MSVAMTAYVVLFFAGQQLDLLRVNLKKWYRKLKHTRSMVEEAIWSVFQVYPCIGYLSVFHDLIHHKSYISRLKVLSSVQELFEGTNESPRHVLMEGHTGIGKTTLCKEICYQWAEDNLFTPDQLVLLLLLQDPDAQKITSEFQLAEYFTTSRDFIKPFSEYLISSHGVGVTIVIDSFGQLKKEVQDEGFLIELIKGIRLPRARIFIASTPFGSYCLHKFVDRRVEIFELVKTIKNNFIAVALKEHPVTLNILQKHFQKYPEIDMLSCIPINMGIIVSLCQKITILKLIPAYLLCNSVKIYEAFCETAAVTEMNQFLFHTQGTRNYHEMWYSAKKKLDYFAFVALIRNNVIFMENDLFDLCKKHPICYSFMQSTECYSSAYHEKRVLFNFLCQGVQCYLAASYVKSCDYTNTEKILNNCLATKMPSYFYCMPVDWSMRVLSMCVLVFKMAKDVMVKYKIIDENTFICRLNEDFESYNVHSVKSQLYAKQMSDTGLLDGNPILAQFDIDTKEFEDSVACNVENLTINVEAPLDITTEQGESGFISKGTSPKSKHTPGSKHSLQILKWPSASELNEKCDSGFSSKNVTPESKHSPGSKHNAQIFTWPSFPEQPEQCDTGFHSKGTSPRFNHTPRTKLTAGSKQIFKWPSFPEQSTQDIELQKSSGARFQRLCMFQLFSPALGNNGTEIANKGIIDFTNYYFLPYHIVSLGLFLSNTTEKVNELHLIGCSIGDYGLYLLQRFLCVGTNHDLKVINLTRNNLTSASSVLINILIDRVKPHSLGLSHNSLRDTGVARLHTTVIRNGIQELYIVNNQLTVQGSKSIVPMMYTLEQLDVSYNSIGDDGAKALSQGILYTSVLKSLHINHCEISTVGTGEITHALTVNSSLGILWMNGNAIGHCGAADIAKMLCTNQSLKELSLTEDITINARVASIILASCSKNDTLQTMYLPTSLTLHDKILIKVKLKEINFHKNKTLKLVFR